MSLRVEEWPVADHMALWRSLLIQTRDTSIDERVLAWRYLDNPDGVARAWVLVDGASGEVGGFTVVMPRRMRVRGRELLAWIGADFSILPRFRALGPALQLRRAARDAIDAGEADLLYSFPNERMMLIHERAGHHRLGGLRRHAHPVSLQPHLKRAIGPVGAALLAPALNIVWRFVALLRTGGSDVVTQISVDAMEAHVDAAALVPPDRVAAVRDRAYFDWRYRRQPGWRGGLLVAHRGGRRTGYLVYTEEAELLQISDLVAADDAATFALVAYAGRVAARAGRASVSYVALEKGLWEDALMAAGFREREERHAVSAYVPVRHAELLDAREPGRWHLTAGDRDI